MSNFGQVGIDPISEAFDLTGSIRTSISTPQFDGRVGGIDDTILWNNQGTGTFTFQSNKMNMSVNPGQFCIRSGTASIPYFSGNPLKIRLSFDQMAPQVGIIKRVGYYSSNASSPFDSDFDGIYIECDGNIVGTDLQKFSLNIARNGVSVRKVFFSDFRNKDLITKSDGSAYDWNGFSVFDLEFVWLGGAGTKISFVSNGRTKELHLIPYAGEGDIDVMMVSPNHPIRYEIRSTTGTGSFRAICSQATSEGAFSEIGEGFATFNQVVVDANSVGTEYALIGLRKSATFRSTPIEIISAGVANVTNTDSGIIVIRVNPTVAGTFNYLPYEKLEIAQGSATNTVTGGTIIACGPAAGFSGFLTLQGNQRRHLRMSLTNVGVPIVVSYLSVTAVQQLRGFVNGIMH